jgi:hypothetical protein
MNRKDVVFVILALLVWTVFWWNMGRLWGQMGADRWYAEHWISNPSVAVPMSEEEFYAKLPKPPPPIHYSLDDMAGRMDHISKGVDLIQRFTDLQAKTIEFKDDCVRQTPEEWERLRCESRQKKLLAELESLKRDKQRLDGGQP